MGDKIHSKVIARKANISMIPGYDGEVKDEDECIRVSNDIGIIDFFFFFLFVFIFVEEQICMFFQVILS